MLIKNLLRIGYRLIPAGIRPIARRSYDALIGEPHELIRYYRNNDRPAEDLRDKLESRFHWFVDNFIRRIPQRRQISYLTHLPVLLALAEHCQVRRVLELGCGVYSTPTFLDREYFPELERLDSIENDAAWGEKVRESVGEKNRLDLRVVAGAMADALGSLNLESYDLIFVDDSLTTGQRSRTIRSLTSARHPVVVIHDFDTPVYRSAARGFAHRFRFTALNPNTGVAWNDARLQMSCLQQANSIVKTHFREIPLDDPAEFQKWLRVRLKGLLRSGIEV